MSSKIARPASMQSINRPAKQNTVDTFACNRASTPIKKPIDIKVGQKVCIPTLSQTGTVKFFGGTKFKPNEMWVGIELDTKGAGKNDGRIQGVRYFTCPPNSGVFVTANKVVPISTDQPKPTKSIVTSQTPKRLTAVPTKQTKATLYASKSIKSTVSPQTPKQTKSSVTLQKSSKVIAPQSKATKLNTLQLKSNKSRATTPQLKSNKSRATTPQPRSSKSRATTPQLKSSKPRATTPQPKSSKSRTTTPQPKTSKSSRSRAATPQVQPKATRVTTPQQKGPKTTPSKTQASKPSDKIKSPSSSEPTEALGYFDRPRREAPQMVRSKTADSNDLMVGRLLSVKESYAIQVQEQSSEISQLKRALEDRQQSEERMIREIKEANIRASYAASLQQHLDRLDQRVQSLTKERDEQDKRNGLERRDFVAYQDQLRKQLTDRDHALATVEKEYAEVRKTQVDTVRSCQEIMENLKMEHASERECWESDRHRLEIVIKDLRLERYLPAESISDDTDQRQQRLETQLDLTTQELDRERQTIQSMAAELDLLKEELKNMHILSSCARQEYQNLERQFEQEVKDKRQIMEEADAALEAQTNLEEEHESMRLSYEKAQHDLTELLKRLASVDKKKQGSGEEILVESLREENERLLIAQKESEKECMRLMDALCLLGYKDSDDRELDQLRSQVSRERKRYEDMERTLEQKVERLNKELVDLESLVENKVFTETELEERLENEQRKVGVLEIRLREVERQMMIPTPTSPVACNFKLKQPIARNKYCEICELYGHDLMSCTALSDLSIKQPEEINLYCVNCDEFDTHSTEQCPNYDETF